MKLYQHIKRSPFRIYAQLPTIHPGEGEIRGRPDIVIETNAPQWEEQLVNIECKRLRRKDGQQPCRSGNSEYIDGETQGMTAFTSGKYKAPFAEGIMIGYILCDCEDPIESLNCAIIEKASLLALQADGQGLTPSSLIVTNPHVKETRHSASENTPLTRLSHIFLFSAHCTKATSEKRSAKKRSAKKRSAKKRSAKKRSAKKRSAKKQSVKEKCD